MTDAIDTPIDISAARTRDLLDFEREWWCYAGAKEQAIARKFSCSTADYYRRLDQVIDSDEAYALDPMLIKRLRRLRAQRQRQRSRAGS